MKSGSLLGLYLAPSSVPFPENPQDQIGVSHATVSGSRTGRLLTPQTADPFATTILFPCGRTSIKGLNF